MVLHIVLENVSFRPWRPAFWWEQNRALPEGNQRPSVGCWRPSHSRAEKKQAWDVRSITICVYIHSHKHNGRCDDLYLVQGQSVKGVTFTMEKNGQHDRAVRANFIRTFEGQLEVLSFTDICWSMSEWRSSSLFGFGTSKLSLVAYWLNSFFSGLEA